MPTKFFAKGRIFKIDISSSRNIWYTLWHGLVGFFITALALCLGAPFWFDLLNKLVSIRGVGVKPEEKKKEKEDILSKRSSVQYIPPDSLVSTKVEIVDKAEIALENFTNKLKNEVGIVGIGLEPENDNPSAIIIVMVETQQIKDYLIKKYGKVEVVEDHFSESDNFSIPVKYSIQTSNEVHASMVGGEIGNKNHVLGHGTLGCFLRKKESNMNYILSCWHVMKDNTQWDTAIIEKEIIDSSNQVIGSVEQGCLSNTIDVGIAVYNDKTINSNAQFSIKSQHREVKPFDALAGTPVQLFGKVCKLQAAKIFHHKVNAQLKYPDGKMHFINDVFSITNNMQSPTSGGDSGAVVTDMNGTPLGMIIGGNGVFSYAVKFTNMFNDNTPYSEYSFLI